MASRRVWYNGGMKKMFTAVCALCAALSAPVARSEGSEDLFAGSQWLAAPDAGIAAPVFETRFVAAADGPAPIAICGLGQYVATLNGKPLGRGDEFNLPGWSRTSKTCLYNVFRPVLKAGETNVLSITLGNGMYNVPPPGKGLYTKFVGSEGEKKLLVGGAVKSSVEGWTVRGCEVVRTHVYSGDDIDRTSAPSAPAAPRPASPPGGELREAPFVCRMMETRESVRVMRVSAKELTVDFGQNAAYVPVVAARGPRGSRVEIEFSEIPLAEGQTRITARPGGYGDTRARCAFTLAGTGGEEEFSPPFFYYGYRYMKVLLFPAREGGELPSLVKARSRVVMADVPRAGSFKCSLELFDKIHDICVWAQRSNMQSVFTDCPHREKLGWLEQDHIHADQIRWGWGAEAMFAKTCRDIADSQLANGMCPDIAPEFTVFNGGFRHSIEWGSAIIQIPWQQYEWTGDASLAREYWPNMVAYHEYIRKLSQSAKHGPFVTPGGLGDWYQNTVSAEKRPVRKTSFELTATAFYFRNAATLAKCARLLGREAEAAAFEREAENIKEAFNAKWWKDAQNCYENNSQTANSIALVFGLAPAGREAAIVSNIVEDVRARGDAVGTGEIGYPYLLEVLAANGRDDVIYDMTRDDTRPGYGYMIAKGNTTCHEAWDARASSSHNHFMMADIVNWFYGSLAGIKRTSPGFKTFEVSPAFLPGVDWVEASHETPGGTIRVEWRRENPGAALASLRVEVPEGSVASVVLPGGAARKQGPGMATYRVETAEQAGAAAGRRRERPREAASLDRPLTGDML